MAIFDGHNDLLLNLWLHHREGSGKRLLCRDRKQHISTIRVSARAGWPAACSPSLCRRRSISPAWRRSTPARRGIRGRSLWQQLAILKAICAHDASRARLCLSAADIRTLSPG
ncbi:dipeptidase [Klebsiella variicola subsp. variicola]|nr:dipeptidase [Klebsiella variicola subsp. variicola]